MYCLHDIRRNFTRKSNTADGRIDKEIGPNMGGISGYVDHMKAKFLTEWGVQTGFRHLLFLVNSKNPVFKPFVAYFFVKFLKFICCIGLYFYGKHAIIQGYGGSSHET